MPDLQGTVVLLLFFLAKLSIVVCFCSLLTWGLFRPRGIFSLDREAIRLLGTLFGVGGYLVQKIAPPPRVRFAPQPRESFTLLS